MAERPLNERFIDLEDRMISVEALTRYGTANDLRFYIFDYAPADELLVRKETKKLKERNPAIVEFDLDEMRLDIIEEEGYMEDVLRMEKDYEKDLLSERSLSTAAFSGGRRKYLFGQVQGCHSG